MSLFGKITSIFKTQKSTLTQEDKENIYSILINSDLTTSLVSSLMDNIKKTHTKEEAFEKLQSRMISILQKREKTLDISSKEKPFVIFVAGVNGSGKTTTIGKLAKKFTLEGKKVLIGACDTFRVAAVEQLAYWCEKSGSIIEKPLKEGEDPASVCYRSLKKAQEENFDVLILDTSGRLQTNKALMDELTKMQFVLKKLNTSKPDLTLCVVDGSAGQNAISQCEEFGKYIKLDGICITKLDSSSKGGAIFSIANSLDYGIYFSGFGEGIEDMSNFNAKDFVDNIFKNTNDNN